MYRFEILPQSWYKRRQPTEKPREIEHVEVSDFAKIDGHRCDMQVLFSDGERLALNARVYVNRTYQTEPDGTLSYRDNSWGVQGTNAEGVSIVLRLCE